MKLKDFAAVAIYGGYLVGVYDTGEYPIEEFEHTDKSRLEYYSECIVTGVWVLDENTMCVSILTESD